VVREIIRRRRPSMPEFVPPSLEEVWDWKRQDEEALAGLGRI